MKVITISDKFLQKENKPAVLISSKLVDTQKRCTTTNYELFISM